jgi:hypothetical protein
MLLRGYSGKFALFQYQGTLPHNKLDISISSPRVFICIPHLLYTPEVLAATAFQVIYKFAKSPCSVGDKDHHYCCKALLGLQFSLKSTDKAIRDEKGKRQDLPKNLKISYSREVAFQF